MPDAEGVRSRYAVGWPLLVGAVAAGGIVLGLSANWHSLAEVWRGFTRAAWLLPGLVGLHLGQLFLAAMGWRTLFAGSGPSVATFYSLRVVREGIDSLLPVAQVGGEVVGAHQLARHGVALTRAGASVIVDVTVELLTQVAFLVLGLGALRVLYQDTAWSTVSEVVLAAGAAAAGLLLAQRFGALRAVEVLARGIAQRWPALAGTSLDGLHAATVEFYRERGALLRSVGLHLLAWMLGTVEAWAVLRTIGSPVSALQAFVIESLGMAGRSAGFAIPAALGVQEGGFVIAGIAVGVPIAPALALSFVKRSREILVGMIGLVLWRLAVRRPVLP